MAKALIPDIHVQESISEVLNDVKAGKIPSETFWVEIGGVEVRFDADGNDKLKSNSPSYTALVTPAAMQLSLYHEDNQIGIVRFGEVRAAVKNMSRVSAGDVFGSRTLIGTDSGELKVLDLVNHELGDITLDGHLLHTSVAQFFPSGQVALSAGMDFAMKIWDLNSGSLVQTLKHQKGIVDDVKMIGKGRNIISLCEKVGSIALWEVGKPQVLNEYIIPGVTSMGLWQSAVSTSSSTSSEAAALYEVDGKVGIAGTDKAIVTFDIRTSFSASNTIVNKPSESILLCGHHLISAHNNEVSVTDIRMPQNELHSIRSAPGTSVVNLEATPSKIYMSTGSAIYGYELSSNTIETLCSEDQGVMATYNNELWHLGDKIVRHFPL